MNGQRALELLGSFEAGELAFTAAEIDELLARGLVIEADPDHYAMLQWLGPFVSEHADSQLDDPEVAAKLAAKLGHLDERLKSDWHRFATSHAHLAEEEQERRAMRRALGILNDPLERARLVKLMVDARTLMQPGAKYLTCKQLGDELYALAAKGARVWQALSLRADRYKDFPLAAFLKAFEKTETKMAAFSGEISTLSSSIGYVKKNPHQVVIGLAKMGQPAAQALDSYQKGVRMTGAPDVAVTLARNAGNDGTVDGVAKRLREAIELLQHAGFPAAPVTFGAAKTLLPFEPLQDGVVRLNSLVQLLERTLGCRGDASIKLAARLMAAEGSPEELVQRAGHAVTRLRATASSSRDELPTAIALASMVRTDDAIEPLVTRFRELADELGRNNLSAQGNVDADALECVACPGTPTEVAETVRMLVTQLARQQGRDPVRADVAIAVAFAKRFAY